MISRYRTVYIVHCILFTMFSVHTTTLLCTVYTLVFAVYKAPHLCITQCTQQCILHCFVHLTLEFTVYTVFYTLLYGLQCALFNTRQYMSSGHCPLSTVQGSIEDIDKLLSTPKKKKLTTTSQYIYQNLYQVVHTL